MKKSSKGDVEREAKRLHGIAKAAAKPYSSEVPDWTRETEMTKTIMRRLARDSLARSRPRGRRVGYCRDPKYGPNGDALHLIARKRRAGYVCEVRLLPRKGSRAKGRR